MTSQSKKIILIFIISSLIIFIAGLVAIVALRQTSNKAPEKVIKSHTINSQNQHALSADSPEIQNLIDSLQLTDKGRQIIEDIEVKMLYNDADIWQVCGYQETSESSQLSGCYIYEPDGDKLIVAENFTASYTLAHEFLHAAYLRIPAEDLAKLESLLEETYQDNHLILDQLLKVYNFSDEDVAERLDELHSFIGTEISNLPDELENHYGQYFQDRTIILELDTDNNLPHYHDNLPRLNDTTRCPDGTYEKTRLACKVQCLDGSWQNFQSDCQIECPDGSWDFEYLCKNVKCPDGSWQRVESFCRVLCPDGSWQSSSFLCRNN